MHTEGDRDRATEDYEGRLVNIPAHIDDRSCCGMMIEGIGGRTVAREKEDKGEESMCREGV